MKSVKKHSKLPERYAVQQPSLPLHSCTFPSNSKHFDFVAVDGEYLLRPAPAQTPAKQSRRQRMQGANIARYLLVIKQPIQAGSPPQQCNAAQHGTRRSVSASHELPKKHLAGSPLAPRTPAAEQARSAQLAQSTSCPAPNYTQPLQPPPPHCPSAPHCCSPRSHSRSATAAGIRSRARPTARWSGSRWWVSAGGT